MADSIWPDAGWVSNLRKKLGESIFPQRDYSWAHEPVEPLFPNQLGVIPNLLLNLPEAGIKAFVRTGERAMNAVQPFTQALQDNLLVPEAVLDKRDADAAAVVEKSKADAAVQSPSGGVIEKPANEVSEFSLGNRFKPIPPPEIGGVFYPDAPDMPAPAAMPTRQPMDFTPFLERMDEYRPEDLDRKQYMKERLLANLSRAFAAGAGGSGWSGGAGAFARFGAGFGTNQADTTDAFLEEQAGIDEDQAQFGMNRIGLEMKLAQEADNIAFENEQTQWQNQENIRQNDIANNAAEYNVLTKNIAEAARVDEANADRLWQYNNAMGDRYETKILPGTGKGNIVLDTTDSETGERTLKYINLNDETHGGLYSEDTLDRLGKIKTVFGEDDPAFRRAKYGPALAIATQDGGLQVKRLMAEEALQTGGLEQIIGEDALVAATEAARRPWQIRVFCLRMMTPIPRLLQMQCPIR